MHFKRPSPFNAHDNVISGLLDELSAVVVAHLKDLRSIDFDDVVTVAKPGVISDRSKSDLNNNSCESIFLGENVFFSTLKITCRPRSLAFELWVFMNAHFPISGESFEH